LCKDDADVVDVLRFLCQREVVHFQRFGEALRVVQDKLAQKNYYMNDCNNNTNSFECTNTFNSVNNY
jgi:Mn-containing catalase